MENQNADSKPKNRWGFLTRGDSSTMSKRSSSSLQRNVNCSPQRDGSRANVTSSVSPRSEMISTSLSPVGLSGPTAFEFSPPLEFGGNGSRQEYMSFVSSHKNALERNVTASGSPVRAIGGSSTSWEKRLFAMDLDTIWTRIDRDDEFDRLGMGASRGSKQSDRGNHMLEANIVMEKHVSPLLNTSLPFNRPHGHNSTDVASPISDRGRSNNHASSPNSLAGVSDTSLSLEEKLRRERQRVHSNGVTQFTWGAYELSDNEESSALPSQERHKVRSPRKSARKRPIPERAQAPMDVDSGKGIRIIIPLRGNIYIQDGLGLMADSPLRLLYNKSMLERNENDGRKKSKRGKSRNGQNSSGSTVGRDSGAIDPQLSPDGSMVAFVVGCELYVMSCCNFISPGTDAGQTPKDASALKIDCDVGKNAESSLLDTRKPTRLTYGAVLESEDEWEEGVDGERDDDDEICTSSKNKNADEKEKKNYGRSVTHGLADFIAQEEMDRYQGFWWNKDSSGVLFARVDESKVPPYRITHQGSDGMPGEKANYEEHRYPFAGETNPEVTLGYVRIDRKLILSSASHQECEVVAKQAWSAMKWFEAPDGASEYLARVNWITNGMACVQWQDRRQSTLLLVKIDVNKGDSIILHREQSDIWINLHHMFKVLPMPIHPNECLEDDNETEVSYLPEGSLSYVFVSERSGYGHMYLYTYIPGDISATLLRAVSSGDWIVESILGVDIRNDLIYFMGTYDSPLEKQLYALPLKSSKDWNDETSDKNFDGVNGMRRSLRQVMSSLGGSSKDKGTLTIKSYEFPQPVCSEEPPKPLRLTLESGMHSVVMDESCRIFIDTSSDLSRPTSTKIYSIPATGPIVEGKEAVAKNLKLQCVLYDAAKDFIPSTSPPPPELMSFPTSDGTETLHAALYRPNPKLHGPGPYPLICAVYGGPHVQRVTRSWCQCADMRVQRLCSMGFAVVKCDNRGSSRRGLQFEGAVKKNLGRAEVLDQVTAVRYLVMKRIADPLRVGICGWSYGGYLAAMCLCRAPDVFSVAIAGAPVTSWDGYDSHYTERYMGLPSENQVGYEESAVFEHVANMKGKLLIIHGLIDENVHFRHTARLVNRLIAAGKDYDLLLFPDERHSPRRPQDRMYMEKRLCDYFIKNLLPPRSAILGNL